MLRVIGALLCAASSGVLAVFGAITYFGLRVDLDPTEVVPIWMWIPPIVVAATGLAMIVSTRRRRDD
jgi:cytochrome c-type biogenesis protein CcmH/NrfF